MAESPSEQSPSGAVLQLVSFFLDASEFALPITQVQEINRLSEITQIPNAPFHILGVINLRGQIVPVMELKRRLNVGEVDRGESARIIVVEVGSKTIGLMVDKVAQVLHIPESAIDPPPSEVASAHDPFIRGVGKIGNRMILVLNLEQVVAGG